MLYVFHVNTGRMMTFDMSSALDTVHTLKDTIEKNCGIPTANQVLLISGGEILQSHAKVFSYSSGTDTNPIFMFSTNNLHEPAPIVHLRDEHHFTEVVQGAVALPSTYSTVVTRAKIAQQLYEVADEETTRCERMVYEQHLQQQGWLAVVANMEDLTKEFRQRFTDFYACLDEHLGRRPEYQEYLASFEEDLRTLDRIPISPSLVAASGHQSFDGFGSKLLAANHTADSLESTTPMDATSRSSDGDSKRRADAGQVADGVNPVQTTFIATALTDDVQPSPAIDGVNQFGVDDTADREKATDAEDPTLTLLQWLTARDAQSSLHNVAENCGRIIDMFDAPMIQQLKLTVESVIGQAKQESMREIRGVAPRFQGLDKLMCNATKLVKEQCKIATAFQHNQSRLSDLGDASILPDLCESHASQLNVMLANHTHLNDIHRRITISKEELSNNLVTRIRFMVQLENRMSELDAKMLFFNRCLRRVQRHLVIIEQIHCAPGMYVQAIGEVIRRRTFTTCFVRWSTELVSNWSGIYNEEVSRRHDFSSRFEGHFLNGLFTGLEDVPPAYAIEEPLVFDANLPNVTMNDMIALSKIIPELTAQVTVPDLSTVIQFFMTHSNRFVDNLPSVASSGAAASLFNQSNAVTAQQQQQQQQHQHQHQKHIEILYHLKDGCDSETDTEEFEKLDKLSTPATSTTNVVNLPEPSTSTANVTRSTYTERIEMHNMETITDLKLSGFADLQRMRDILRDMHETCVHTFGLLRERLADLKDYSVADRQRLEHQFAELGATWRRMDTETRTEGQAQLDHLAFKHRQELASMQQTLNGQQAECDRLRSEIVDLAMINTNVQTEAGEAKVQLLQVIGDLNVRAAHLEQRLADAEHDKQQAVRDTHDTMQRTHKTEIESLRSRFKLMANMERSPSDTSLEKIERSDCVEAVAPDFVSTQIDPLQAAVVQQQPRAATFIAAQSPGKNSVDVFRQILFNKEQELLQMRQDQQQLETENKSLREAIQVLTVSSSTASEDRYVRLELAELKKELNMERKKRIEMEQSFFTAKEKDPAIKMSSPPQMLVSTSANIIETDETNSPLADPTTLTATQSSTAAGRPRSSCSRRMVCIDGCTKGDNVLVMWNPQHNQYTILQDNPIIYFLHPGSYDALHLEAPDTSAKVCMATLSANTTLATPPHASLLASSAKPLASSITPSASSGSNIGGRTADVADSGTPPWRWSPSGEAHLRQTPAVIGKLIDKEFCYARKDMNRYKVQRGARFYRVKVGATSPTRCSDPNGKCCAKRIRQDSEPSGLLVNGADVAVETPLPTVQTVAKSDSQSVRQNLFISSFAQTDSDPLAVELPGLSSIIAPTELSPAVVDSSMDTVDVAIQAGTNLFDENRHFSGARYMPTAEDEFVSLSERTSLYQTSEEVFELASKVTITNNPQRLLSSASSETAPVLDRN